MVLGGDRPPDRYKNHHHMLDNQPPVGLIGTGQGDINPDGSVIKKAQKGHRPSDEQPYFQD